jgi:hypothetical protein
MTCPACRDGRRHTAEETQHHALAGHGFIEGQGWCCEEAKQASETERESRKA